MIVDLSHVLRTGIQIYPGDPEVEIKEALNVEKISSMFLQSTWVPNRGPMLILLSMYLQMVKT